jgi:hypothetical protein
MSDPFPTRQFPYRRVVSPAASLQPALAVPNLPSNVLHRFILGVDDLPTAMPVELNDPFAKLLRQSPFPLDARSLVNSLDATGLRRRSFFAGDGAQIPWTPETSHIARQIRTVVAWTDNDELAVLLATAPPYDDPSIFLQVIGWDSVARHFSFYERRLGTWIFAGSSPNALDPASRGKGPFDSHVNGALVMKELKAPWLHWSSLAAFEMPGIAPDSAVLNEPLFAERQGAEVLEQLVRTGIHRWTESRLDGVTRGAQISNVRSLVQHLLTSTSVNLVSSMQTSSVPPTDGILRIPQTPFLDTNLLLDELRIESDANSPTAPWEHYQKAIDKHGYELRDEFGQLAAIGDTHFAFPAFERAEEDRSVVAELIRRKLLTERLVACLAMVDFPNPISSPRRAALFRHVPDTANRTADGWDLSDAIRSSILAAMPPGPGSPEEEFAELWAVGENWRTHFGQIIDQYLAALQNNLQSWEGFEAVARLIAFRRHEARSRPLLEFKLTLPVTAALPYQRLRITRQATIEEY